MCRLINLPLKSIIRGILWWRRSCFEVFFLLILHSETRMRLAGCSPRRSLLRSQGCFSKRPRRLVRAAPTRLPATEKLVCFSSQTPFAGFPVYLLGFLGFGDWRRSFPPSHHFSVQVRVIDRVCLIPQGGDKTSSSLVLDQLTFHVTDAAIDWRVSAFPLQTGLGVKLGDQRYDGMEDELVLVWTRGAEQQQASGFCDWSSCWAGVDLLTSRPSASRALVVPADPPL